jgi:AcrR family transcriptional regulator
MPKLYPGYREEVRKKIVAEAYTLFREKGYSRTTMEEIAGRLGVTKPAIYLYFKNKEELFTAVAERGRQELAGILSRSFATGDLLEGSGVLFDSLLEFVHTSMEIYHDIMLVASRNESVRAILREDRIAELQVIQQFIEEQKEKGRIHPEIDAKVLAWACDALINGLMFNVMIGADPAEAKRVWVAAVEDLLRVRR